MTQDQIQISSNYSTEWIFWMESKARTLSGQRDEIASHCSTLFETFDEFIRPKEVKLTKGHYGPNTTIESLWNKTSERLDLSEEIIAESTGVDISEVLTACEENPPSQEIHIPRLDVSKAATRLQLSGEPVWVDRNAHTVSDQGGTSGERAPRFDPLRFTLMQGFGDDDRLESPYSHDLIVKSRTPIWFEDSERGERNAERLSDFLSRINEALPVKNITRHTEIGSKTQMKAIF